MEVEYADQAKNDIAYWKKVGNKAIQTKIQALIRDMQEHPETGIGKPEQLKYGLTGFWSRRINKEHRVVYRFTATTITVISLKDHY